MTYNQRDLVWLNEPTNLPDGTTLDHPVLLISCRAANAKEDFYTAVMMTTSEYQDMFSFKVDNNMFEANLDKTGCQFRTYILLPIREVKIKKLANRMKKVHFEVLMKRIKDYVLSVDA